MITFKQYLLTEDVFAKGDELLAAVNDDTKNSPSTPGRINTNRHALGRMASTTRDTPVYYAFSYVPDEKTTAVLTSIKGNGPYSLTDVRRSKFLNDATQHMAAQFKRMKLQPDIVITPRSSSPFLHDFAERLADAMGVETGFLDAFSKTDVDLPPDPAAALEYIKKHLIDYDYIEKKFVGDKAAMIDELAKMIRKNIKDNGGKLAAKAIWKPYAKFVKGFMRHNLEGDHEYDLIDKNVMVVDDVLSSGTTFSELFRIAKDELQAAEVWGAALFSRTGTTH